MNRYNFVFIFIGVLFCLLVCAVRIYKNKQLGLWLRAFLILILACMSAGVTIVTLMIAGFTGLHSPHSWWWGIVIIACGLLILHDVRNHQK